MNDSILEFKENAGYWWNELDDDEKQRFIEEIYAKKYKIRIE